MRELSQAPCQALRGGMGSWGPGGGQGSCLGCHGLLGAEQFVCPCAGMGVQGCWDAGMLVGGHQRKPAPWLPHPLLLWRLVAKPCVPGPFTLSSGKRREEKALPSLFRAGLGWAPLELPVPLRSCHDVEPLSQQENHSEWQMASLRGKRDEWSDAPHRRPGAGLLQGTWPA